MSCFCCSCMTPSPKLLHFSSLSFSLLLRRPPVAACAVLTITCLHASPPHLWWLLILSHASIMSSTPRCSLSREEVLRQSGFNRNSFKPLLTSGTDYDSKKWACLWLSALRSWAKAGLSHLCTQLQECKLLEGREGSYFCNMPWQSPMMHAARCPRRQEIF